LNVGDYSPPFVVGNKVNILKITDRRLIPAFENFQHDIIDRLKYFDYINNFKVMENKAIGKEIPYKINFDTYNQLLEISSLTSICDSLFIKQIKHLGKNEIVSIDNKKYNVEDFLIYFSNNKKIICSIYKLTTDALYYGLNSFIYDRLLALKDEQLIDNKPQLKSIADEFYNGLLYFDIMSDEVWDKAQNDNVNLEQYYFDNQDKYKWTEPRYEGYLIFTKNKDLMQKAKQIIENNKENISVVLKDSLNKNKEINIIVDKGFWSKGENEYIDELLYNIPTSRAMIGYPYYFFEGIKIEQPRSVNDVRGSVIADYQAILENEWIKSLRQKSSITINENVLKSISNKSIIN
jgi:peptidyl-prolyl cis-trans isomerase SurA